ncbi:hypothetical protein F975_01874 [Acinetobacter sp. ANC 3789]|uniref:hypothetical protein n=1 Tax=Acinetobacter sp. ANC 3789 TaxID=1217714 RepID=UPI0002CE5CEC|nr:hypothetical protein [Acinetobacter sp. ANC 3789]ENU80121.1 hypothetical protein F975_01874 [Acinetobacter sp. ANC 3789]
MWTHLSTILTFISSLAIITPIIKFIFLRSYRTQLKRTSFIEKRDLLEKFYNESYKKRGSRNKFLLQCDANILLGEDKYSYQTIFSVLKSDYQHFYKVINNLKYAKQIIKEKKIGNNIILYSPYSKKILYVIFFVIIIIYLIVAILWLNHNIQNYIEFQKIVSNIKMDLIMIGACCLTPIAARIRVALDLGEKLPIQFK